MVGSKLDQKLATNQLIFKGFLLDWDCPTLLPTHPCRKKQLKRSLHTCDKSVAMLRAVELFKAIMKIDLSKV